MSKRALLIILDSLGVGALPDANNMAMKAQTRLNI